MSFKPAVFMVLALGFTSGATLAAESSVGPSQRLDAAIAATPSTEPASDAKALRDFYKSRGGLPVWSEARTAAMVAEMQAVATAEGLNPATYVPGAADSELQRDLLVSAALLRFGRDLAIGAVQPDRAFGGFGQDSRGQFDGARFLRDLAEGKTLRDLAASAVPQFIGYARLKQALEQTRAIARAGGWPQLPDGPKLVPGDSDDRIPTLRKRLVISGDLSPTLADGREFDAALVDAVRRFQGRHGLDPDGTVGARTFANLNVTAEARIRQIAANLERWRWMTRQPGRHHVAVNIPAAMLDVVEDGAVALSMRVVVGDVKHPTPSMNTSMSSLVLNPPWSVPASIANKEILPKLRRDPNYLATSNLKIIEYPEDSPEAAGDGIDWNAIGKKFPYRLRQPPGPDNALGRLKFNLKDSDDIYMHDTPNRKAFARSYRALSHGCVRLERPVDLAELMLGDHWKGRLDADIAAKRSTRTMKLERTVPVYLMYLTAWVDDEGTPHFRDDIYGHDRRLSPALERARQPLLRTAARSADRKL
ncbi:hypothetical protein A6A04_07660 [Paramagnetospirillum marisnigri]|uniref:L,D-TPase catalytic domain-containing protein n=1 Tax=Paramagnetospirillum marisnigri TaxID=1285242 RepID=A0A178M9X4_9PROT|nr:L,D-transpeptidase family protein [Paramagnetospirillum marisnigri]OAN44694.1 hypothetical protein A6A04_07660 [Paramagnetospirillum marisnigri]